MLRVLKNSSLWTKWSLSLNHLPSQESEKCGSMKCELQQGCLVVCCLHLYEGAAKTPPTKCGTADGCLVVCCLHLYDGAAKTPPTKCGTADYILRLCWKLWSQLPLTDRKSSSQHAWICSLDIVIIWEYGVKWIFTGQWSLPCKSRKDYSGWTVKSQLKGQLGSWS